MVCARRYRLRVDFRLRQRAGGDARRAVIDGDARAVTTSGTAAGSIPCASSGQYGEAIR